MAANDSDEQLVHPEHLKDTLKPDSKAGRNILFAIIVIVAMLVIFLAWRP